jgi:hypothetical protein
MRHYGDGDKGNRGICNVTDMAINIVLFSKA